MAAAFGLAALLSSWNPLAAPFGFLVGLGALVLSVRALRAGADRRIAAAGLALASVAVGLSVLVLALTAGVGRDPTGDPVVSGPSRAEAARTLDEAAARTQAARERARKELGSALGAPAPSGPGGPGGPSGPPRSPR